MFWKVFLLILGIFLSSITVIDFISSTLIAYKTGTAPAMDALKRIILLTLTSVIWGVFYAIV